MSRRCPSCGSEKTTPWMGGTAAGRSRTCTNVNIVATLVQSSTRQLAREDSNVGCRIHTKESRTRYHRVFLIPRRYAP